MNEGGLLLSNIPAIFCFLCCFPNISNILVLETNRWLVYIPCSIIQLVHVLVHTLGLVLLWLEPFGTPLLSVTPIGSCSV